MGGGNELSKKGQAALGVAVTDFFKIAVKSSHKANRLLASPKHFSKVDFDELHAGRHKGGNSY